MATKPKKKAKGGGMVQVHINPGQRIIVTNKPKAEDFPSAYFYRWLEACREIEPDVWPRATKHHPNCRRKDPFCVCMKSSIRISDMHIMELVNAIKWCIRQADVALHKGLFSNFSESRASLLATSPQWAELLEEAKKRNLQIISYSNWDGGDHYAQWFEQALIAIGMNKLERKG